MTMAVVSPAWLLQQLEASEHNVVVIEATWMPDTMADYQEARVPTARFVNFATGMDSSPYIPMNLHKADHLTRAMRDAGVGRDSHVVLYDRDRTLWAARVWWTLRVYGHEKVSVLDGGWKEWSAQGLRTDSGKPADVQEGDFSVKSANTEMIATYEDMLKIYKDKSAQIIDARQPDDFAGRCQEPTIMTQMAGDLVGLPHPTDMRAGHIPGSVNLVEDSVLDPETGCMRSEEKLKQLFASVGVDPAGPIVTTCYSGIWATLCKLALYQLGNHNVPMYLGSWTEYGQRASENDIQKTEA